MTGVIWFVQVVHYPLKTLIGEEAFVRYQAAHVQRTGWIVGVPMLMEAATGAWLLVSLETNQYTVLLWAGMLLLTKVWLVTAAFSVRAHHQLSGGFDARAHQMLVSTNWLRTAGWSLRSGLVLWYTQAVV